MPAQGATNVSPNTTVTFTFNEPFDITTLAAGTQVAVSGLSGEVAGQLAVNGNVVTFTPTAPLPGNQSIVATVSGVKDLAGNNNATRSSTFTTGATTDTTPPTVVSITPNDKAVDIGPTTPITLTFSESLNPNTVNNTTFALFVNGDIVQPSVARSQDNRTVVLTTNLPVSSVVAVIATNQVKDLSGNALTDFTSVFTTGVTRDTTRPTVVTQFPGSGASGVLQDASIVFYMSEVMNAGTLQQAMHISQNGQLVGGTVTLSGGGRVIMFQPLQQWSPNALVEVFVDNTAEDINGNALNNYQTSFRISGAGVAAPTVVATSPTYGSGTAPINSVIDLQYSEALDPSTVNATSVVFHDYQTGQVLGAAVSMSKGNRVVHVVPQALLLANHTYYVQTAATLKDLTGQTAASYFLYFATSPATVTDTQPPRVVSMSPPDGSTNVGINGHVHVRFDRVGQSDQHPDGSGTDDVWIAAVERYQS